MFGGMHDTDATATPDWRAPYEDYQRRGLPAGAPLHDG
jgi:hypothetical protein